MNDQGTRHGPDRRHVTTPDRPLPPGQHLARSFERFGLGRFAFRYPTATESISIAVSGDVAAPATFGDELAALPRVTRRADFHCVTTWSVRDLEWGGVRFADFHHALVAPRVRPRDGAVHVVLRAQDGYRVCMLLEDLLGPDVLLADTLDGESLGVAHGAPLRLVAPAHYGYKNLKHLAAIEYWTDRRHYRFPWPYPNLMDHPRARVALEERARFLPAWLIRPFYRMVMPLARAKAARGLAKYMARARGT